MKKNTYKYIVIAVIVLIILGLFLGTLISNVAKRHSVEDNSAETTTEELPEGTIQYNGKNYTPKKNIESYLFMGIDDLKKVEKKTDYDGTGQCDVLILLVRNRSDGSYRTLTIDRDTMMEIKNIMDDGTVVATTVDQVSLSHIRGDGMEMSCEVTVDAVSNYLKGQEITGYAAMNMGGIGILNNLADGVEVTIQDDFSDSDPTLKMGETVTLTDDQAVHYVHDRLNVADGTNENRMSRQSTYLDGLEVKYREKCSDDPKFAMTIYDSISEYTVTNITKKKFAKLASEVFQGKKEESVTIEGSRSEDEETGFVEFTPDEDSLMNAILTLFYEEADE